MYYCRRCKRGGGEGRGRKVRKERKRQGEGESEDTYSYNWIGKILESFLLCRVSLKMNKSITLKRKILIENKFGQKTKRHEIFKIPEINDKNR